MATGPWAKADCVREAASRPWGRVSAVLAALDSSDDPFLRVLDPLPVLSAARALLARARWDVEHGRPADADTAVRAAIRRPPPAGRPRAATRRARRPNRA